MVAKVSSIIGSSSAAAANPTGSQNAPFVGTGFGNTTSNTTGVGTMMTDKGPVTQGSRERATGGGALSGLGNNRYVGAARDLGTAALGSAYPGAGLLMSAIQHGRKGGLGIGSLFDGVPGSYGAIPGVARDIGYNVRSLGGLTSLFDGKPGAGGILGTPIEALNTLSGVGSLFDNKAGSTGAIGAIMSLLGLNQGPNPTYNNVGAADAKRVSENGYAQSGAGFVNPNIAAKAKGALSGGSAATTGGAATGGAMSGGAATTGGGTGKVTGTSVGGGKAGGTGSGPIKEPRKTKKS